MVKTSKCHNNEKPRMCADVRLLLKARNGAFQSVAGQEETLKRQRAVMHRVSIATSQMQVTPASCGRALILWLTISLILPGQPQLTPPCLVFSTASLHGSRQATPLSRRDSSRHHVNRPYRCLQLELKRPMPALTRTKLKGRTTSLGGS